MYLDAVKTAQEPVIIETNSFRETPEVFAKWHDWHASEISHHGAMCCEIAREWLTAKDFSELGGASVLTGPRWLRQKFKWGASDFPIFWCEAVKQDTLDCGALAALASEVFKSRGVRTLRVQMVQRFSANSTAQWSSSWYDTTEQLRWMNDDLIYHEGCAIMTKENEIKIWDASAGWWIDPNSKDGYGALLAIRLSDFNLTDQDKLNWGRHNLNALQWIEIT